jgi:pyridoxamine 5'-phosphate oxidase
MATRPDPDAAMVHNALSEADAAADPLRQFNRWFDAAAAAGLRLPNSMTLATVSAEGHPSARMVLLKGIEQGGFVFYTNYESDKARDLDSRPHAALVFHWKSLERQVRIAGRVERVSAEDSDAYFATRPLGSQHSAWASPQSTVVANRAWLEERAQDYAARFETNVPRPPFWGGYRVLPEMIEFWQGRDDRLHDRLLYRRQADGTWIIERLAP